MPCQGGQSYREVVVESGTIINALTQKLCYLCASLYADDLLEKYGNPEIVAWHKQHMHDDEVRVGLAMQEIYRDHPTRMNNTAAVAAQFLEEAEAVHPVSQFHIGWFHRMAQEAADAVRNAHNESVQEQQLKQGALAKLSPEERTALGLL